MNGFPLNDAFCNVSKKSQGRKQCRRKFVYLFLFFSTNSNAIFLQFLRRTMLLCTDVLREVLAFLHVEVILAGDGLNTASRLFSSLLTRHHPALKRLFAKVPRVFSSMIFWTGDQQVDDRINKVMCNDYQLDRDIRRLPLPLVPASQDILGVGKVKLFSSFKHDIGNPEV
jgi:hypothetical protein